MKKLERGILKHRTLEHITLEKKGIEYQNV